MQKRSETEVSWSSERLKAPQADCIIEAVLDAKAVADLPLGKGRRMPRAPNTLRTHNEQLTKIFKIFFSFKIIPHRHLKKGKTYML